MYDLLNLISQKIVTIIHANFIPSNSVSGVRSYTPSIDSWTIRLIAEI